jgi:hypothetical protein
VPESIVHGKLSNQAPEVLTLAEADRLGCNGPALSPRELTHCFPRLGNLDGVELLRGPKKLADGRKRLVGDGLILSTISFGQV